jgi:hypothetical protein
MVSHRAPLALGPSLVAAVAAAARGQKIACSFLNSRDNLGATTPGTYAESAVLMGEYAMRTLAILSTLALIALSSSAFAAKKISCQAYCAKRCQMSTYKSCSSVCFQGCEAKRAGGH